MNPRRSAAQRLGIAGMLTVALLASGCAILRREPSPSSAKDASDTSPQPPDGRWLTDTKGRDYFVIEMPRVDGQYLWPSEARDRVRLSHGIEYDLESYDDRKFRVKIYRTTKEAGLVLRRAPTEEDLERVAASYRVEATNGDGVELRPFGEGLPRRGQWRNGFDVADMNGDGHSDLVFAPPRKSRRTPVVFLGDGAGRWRPWREATFPPIAFDYGDAAAGDLDGDGAMDLVIAVHLHGIVALRGDGKGRFTTWSEGIGFSSPDKEPSFASREIELADWDGDGRLDVIALGEGPQLVRATPKSAQDFSGGSRGVVVYRNRGDGSWSKLAPEGQKSFGSTLAIADLDGDGRLDFASGSDRRGFTQILGLGRPDGTWTETAIAEPRPTAIYRAAAIADFDRDGRPDLALSYLTSEQGVARSGIDVLLARPSGWERHTLGVEESLVQVYRLATGDFDGDGNPDLVGGDGDGRLWIFRGDGKGGFAFEPVPEIEGTEACRAYGLRLADLDGDRRDELVVSFAEEGTSFSPAGVEPACPSEGRVEAWKVIER